MHSYRRIFRAKATRTVDILSVLHYMRTSFIVSCRYSRLSEVKGKDGGSSITPGELDRSVMQAHYLT